VTDKDGGEGSSQMTLSVSYYARQHHREGSSKRRFKGFYFSTG